MKIKESVKVEPFGLDRIGIQEAGNQRLSTVGLMNSLFNSCSGFHNVNYNSDDKAMNNGQSIFN